MRRAGNSRLASTYVRDTMPLFRRRPRPEPEPDDPLRPDAGTNGRADRRKDRKEGRLENKKARAGVLKWLFFCIAAVIVLILVVKFFIL